MDFIKKHKATFILLIVFVVLLSLYFIREFIASKEIYNESYLDGEDYIMTPKTYGVNEYSVIEVTDDSMVNIYLNDFKNQVNNDINSAYLLLNEQYRNIKFGSLENFINFYNSYNLNNFTIDSYSVNSDKTIFTIYTKENNKIIFKRKSVMEYEVYLDDYTVEI